MVTDGMLGKAVSMARPCCSWESGCCSWQGVGYHRLSEACRLADGQARSQSHIRCQKESSTVLFGSPPRFQTSSEGPVQPSFLPPVVNNCRLAKQREHACFGLACIAYIQHA